MALEGALDLAYVEVCVKLDEALLECHSTFSGVLQPTCGGSLDRGSPLSCESEEGAAELLVSGSLPGRGGPAGCVL